LATVSTIVSQLSKLNSVSDFNRNQSQFCAL